MRNSPLHKVQNVTVTDPEFVVEVVIAAACLYSLLKVFVRVPLPLGCIFGTNNILSAPVAGVIVFMYTVLCAALCPKRSVDRQ